MRRVSIVLLTALLAWAVMIPAAPPAHAQLFGDFFDRLFRPGPRFFPRQMLPPGEIDRPVQRVPSEPQVPKVEIQPKDTNARKVLVVGDFLATGLASGLDQAFAAVPQVTIIDKSNGASGLVRIDRFDWTKELPTVLNEVQPDFIVVMLGTNDRQQLGPKGDKQAVRSEGWLATYNERLASFSGTLKTYRKPVFWVGLPPMRSTSSSADMAAFNALYKTQVESIGGKFVDVWNGFADEEGKFVSRAPDVTGQVRTLRSSDGINFTRAGQNKLAFFVEREIRRSGGISGGEALATSSTSESRIEVGTNGRRWLVGPVISLSEPPPGASTTLDGAGKIAGPKKDSPQFKLVIEGANLPFVPGRVDDFRWPAEPAPGADKSAEGEKSPDETAAARATSTQPAVAQ